MTHEYDLHQQRSFLDSFRQNVQTWWGDRCNEYEPECPCCKAWRLYDDYVAHCDLDFGEKQL